MIKTNSNRQKRMNIVAYLLLAVGFIYAHVYFFDE